MVTAAFSKVGQTSVYVWLMETGEETCKAQSTRANQCRGGPEAVAARETQEQDGHEPQD